MDTVFLLPWIAAAIRSLSAGLWAVMTGRSPKGTAIPSNGVVICIIKVRFYQPYNCVVRRPTFLSRPVTEGVRSFV